MTQVLDRLATLILSNRDNLLSQWRGQVRQLSSAKQLDVPTHCYPIDFWAANSTSSRLNWVGCLAQMLEKSHLGETSVVIPQGARP